MIHLGDITKISGFDAPIVDVITGGSPCQNFSAAGNREGLGGDQSVLFYHQIRIVKEMRECDRNNGRSGVYVRPRYCIWENVPGAFSSNDGKDFQAVLTEFAKIAEPDAPDVPLPEKGKWPKSGCIYDDMGRWSVAYKLHDAQHWGVPQRRKRICVLCDFNGLSAAEILFDPQLGGISERTDAQQAVADTGADPRPEVRPFSEGLRGDFEAGREERKGTAEGAENGIGSAISSTLNNQSVCYCIGGYNSEGMLSPNPHSGIYEAETSRTLDLNGGNPACNQGGIAILCLNDQGSAAMSVIDSSTKPLCIEMTSTKNTIVEDGISPTLTARMGTGGNQINAVLQGCGERQGIEREVEIETYQTVTGPLMANSHPGSYTGQDAYNDMLIARCFQNTGQGWWNESDIGATIRTPCGGDSVKANLVSQSGSVVRRLTPLECERLQGFPDNWTLIGEPEEVEVKDYDVQWVPTERCQYATFKDALAAWHEAQSSDETTWEDDEADEEYEPFDPKAHGFVEKKVCVGTHKEIAYFYTDENGKKKRCADSQRYKALGNSIALPFWQYLARRICAQYERPITMASLFDGISGFPLVFERCGAKAVWASEIEEFPMAVTRARFPEE